MWRELTETDLATVLSGPELERVRQAAGDDVGGDEDQLDAIIATVVDECRGRIEANPRNRVGAAGTLPERVIHHALVIARQRLLTRLDMGISDARTGEYKDARKFFDDVAAGKVTVESPDAGDVVSEANVATVDVVASNTATMKRSQTAGLF